VADSVADHIRRAQAAHPKIACDAQEFERFIAGKCAPGWSLDKLHVESLYLAWACARGDRAALDELEQDYLRKLDPALVRAGAARAGLDEIKQRLRERLLMGSATRGPRIGDYGGRGDFSRWLRAVAVRIVLNHLKGEPRTSDRDLDQLAFDADDPELQHLKEHYRAQFASALRVALAELDSEARSDLRLYYLDGLRLEELAALRRVVPSTMSRRLAAARTAVLEQTGQRMRAALGIEKKELESILRLVGSRLDLSRQALLTKR